MWIDPACDRCGDSGCPDCPERLGFLEELGVALYVVAVVLAAVGIIRLVRWLCS